MPATLIALEKAPAQIAALPDVFAMRLDGNCLEPKLMHGSVGIFARDEWPKRGDLACIWLKVRDPARNNAIGIAPWIKRIVMAPWEHKLPCRLTGDSNLEPLLSFEMDNPHREWTVSTTAVFGLHKFLGKPDDLGLIQTEPGVWRPRPTLEERRGAPVRRKRVLA